MSYEYTLFTDAIRVHGVCANPADLLLPKCPRGTKAISGRAQVDYIEQDIEFPLHEENGSETYLSQYTTVTICHWVRCIGGIAGSQFLLLAESLIFLKLMLACCQCRAKQ
jgi:hypothetical protein